MAVAARSVVYLSFLIVFLLSACGKTDWDVPQEQNIPIKSTTGAEVIVCRAANEVQVYKETGSYAIPPIDFVYMWRGKWLANDSTDGIYISGSIRIRPSNPADNVNKDLNLSVAADPLEPGKTYKLNHTGFRWSSYSVNDQEYFVDTASSEIRFDRLDAAVGAGEFSFTAKHRYNYADTIRIIGWFDIPFEK